MVMKSHTPAGITGSKSGEIWFGGKDKEGRNRLTLNFLGLVASFHISENVAKISIFDALSLRELCSFLCQYVHKRDGPSRLKEAD